MLLREARRRYRGVRRRGLVFSERAGQLSEALHGLLVPLDGCLDGLNTGSTPKDVTARLVAGGKPANRSVRYAPGSSPSSPLQSYGNNHRRLRRATESRSECTLACVCLDLACSSRDLCFPDTRKVLGTATLLVSLSCRGTQAVRAAGRAQVSTGRCWAAPHLHPVHVDASADAVLLTNQAQLGHAVQQAVVKLRTVRRVLPPAQQHAGGGGGEAARYQDEVSVLRCPVLVGQFQDVSFFDELVCWVNDVLFSAQELVDLQQLPHSLLTEKKAKVTEVKVGNSKREWKSQEARWKHEPKRRPKRMQER